MGRHVRQHADRFLGETLRLPPPPPISLLRSKWGVFSSENNKHPFLYIGACTKSGRPNIEVGVKGLSDRGRTQIKIKIATTFPLGWVFLNLDPVSAIETGQMSAAETRQMSSLARTDICLVSTHNVEASEL